MGGEQPAAKSARRSEVRMEKRAKDKGREPYEKPDFQYERVFETMALACGKVNPTQGQCRLSKKQS
jgi:hypothetical protein